MNCFDLEARIGEYVDSALPDGEIEEITRHVRSCTACSSKIDQIRQIETLIQDLRYVEPPPSYWEGVPKTVMRRLGLRPQPSLWARAVEKADLLFDMPGFRYGLAGLGGAAIAILVMNNWPGAEIRPIAQMPGEAVVAEGKLQESQNISDLKGFATPSTTESVAATSTASNIGQVGERAPAADGAGSNHDRSMPRLTTIAARGLQSLQFDLTLEQELIPIPNSAYLLLAVEDQDHDKTALERIEVSSFGSDVVAAPLSTVDPEMPKLDDLQDQKSDFAETAWIVQESQSLAEKKSIWMSYVARETDPTYHSLGVYNLALVLAKGAEESRDREDALEALEFFAKHEKSLRFQMNDSRYDVKVGVLKLLAR